MPVTTDLDVACTVTDAPVAVDGSDSDVEDTAYHKGAGLSVGLLKGPPIIDKGHKDQWIMVPGYHQVSQGQIHHKQITCSRKHR